MRKAPIHKFTVESTADGYGALCQLAADATVYTDGETLDALLVNIQEALALLYEGTEQAGQSYAVELVGLEVGPVG